MSATMSSSSTLELPPALRQVLRPHQIDALHFMWAKLVDHGLLRMAARSQAATIEQRLLLYQEIYGCILGHSMGLGKTLTALAFVWLLQGQIMLMALRREQRRRAEMQSALAPRANPLSSSSTQHNHNISTGAADKVPLCESIRVLVICPRSCVPHWAASVAEWMRPEHVGRVLLDVYLPSSVGNSARGVERMLAEYYRNGGLLIVGYEEYVRLIQRARQPARAAQVNPTRRGTHRGGNQPASLLSSSPSSAVAAASSSSTTAGSFYMRVGSLFDTIRQPLPLPQTVHVLDMLESADLVLLDEAHRLRHGGSQVVQLLARHLHRVQLRIALTGTPLQNHLEAYNIMQSVVTGSDLNAQQFQRYFIAPIERGQCVDSTYQQFTEMQRSVAALRRFFAETVHHCGPDELAKTLPPRREFIFFLRLAASQERLYVERLAQYKPLVASGQATGAVLMWHHEAAHIACHPALAPTAEAVRLASESSATKGKGSGHAKADTNAHRRKAAAQPPQQQKATTTTKKAKGAGGDMALLEGDAMDGFASDESESEEDAKNGDVLQTSEEAEGIARRVTDLTADSPKLAFAIALVQYITGTLHEKVVIFSLYRRHLQLVQALLRHRCGLQAPIFSGSSSLAERRQYIEELAQSPQCRVLLCTVRAGGVGIKLTAANHCILLDVSWNPADDTQATYRVYRYGQTRPVTIYRLAAYGTTEQVVFCYALQKSWLHRKIADLLDPARQERHRTRNYFLYPCPLSLEETQSEAADSTTITTSNSTSNNNNSSETMGVAEKMPEEARVQRVQQFCEVECPTVAAVLRKDSALAAALFSVIPHSLLLRETTTEMIAELGKKFASCQAEAKKHIPIALSAEGTMGGKRHTGDAAPSALRAHGLLERCEPRLVDTGHQLANHLILHTIQRHDSRRAARSRASRRGHPSAESGAYVVDWAQDTTAIVREVDHELRQLLVHFLRPHCDGEMSNSNMLQSVCRGEGPLAEVMLGFYQVGVQRVMQRTLSTAAYLKLRTYLASRLPLHLSSNTGTSSGKTREQRTTHSALEEGLLYCPYELLQNIDAVEQTYVCTELGFDRPLVPQCMMLGLQACLTLTGVSEEVSKAARRLLDCLGSTRCEAGNEDVGSPSASEDEREEEEDEHTEDQPVCDKLRQCVVDCLSDLWPAGHGLAAPALPLGPIALEESRMRKAYAAASRESSTGLIAMHEVAELLHLQHHQGQRELYTCPRCRGTFLRRSDETTLQCLRCHYNAEFELRSDLTRQQHAVLYQLACVCNALDAFSVTRSFSTTFAPAQCTTVAQVLQRLRGAAPVVYFVEKCMHDGVQVLCDDFPPLLVHLLALQCGLGEDYDLLRRVLLANAALVWGKSLRRHVRDRLAQQFRTLLQPSSLARLTSMPMMAIILALQHAVQHEGITYAQELLPDDMSPGHAAGGAPLRGAPYRARGIDNDDEDNGEAENHKPNSSDNEEGDRMSTLTDHNSHSGSEAGGLPVVSHGRALLRFVADGLVKLLYAERLLANCSQPCTVAPHTGHSHNDAADGPVHSTSSQNTHSSSSPFSSSPPSFYSHSSSRSVSPQPPPQQQQQQPRRRTTASGDKRRGRGDELMLKSSSSSSSSSSSRSRRGRRRSASRRKRSRSRSRPRRRSRSRRRSHRRRGRSRSRSPSPSSSSSSWFSSSSSLRSCYSSGRATSVGSSASSNATTRTAASSRTRGLSGTREDSLSFAPVKTREELESEAVLAQRSAQYWIAFCEVYGSQSAEKLTVYVDDAQRGLVTLAAPPTHAWLTELQRTTKSGMAIGDVVTAFVEKVMELSQSVRLIR